MTTLQGAIRTSLALEQGWRPGLEHRWPEELGGPDDPGELQFRGPYLYLDGQPLYNAPLVLLARKHARESYDNRPKFEFIRLVPGPEVECDLGVLHLPVPAGILQGAGLPQGLFLTRSGMESVLKGKVPSDADVREKDFLWSEEHRTGLERDDQTRTAAESKLYNCIHVRPGHRLELVVLVTGIPGNWKIRTRRVVTLGGEGRLAEVRVEPAGSEDVLPIPALPVPGKDHKIRFTVTLVTPGWYDDPLRVILEGPPGVPGRCISACVGKVEQAGGWDLANQEPRPLVPLLPAGCTWFFETGEADIKKVAALHGHCLGDRSAYGFGQVVIGKWEEDVQ
jgi:CRISPR-associated protein Cmr3